jgi:hypothetical protein
MENQKNVSFTIHTGKEALRIPYKGSFHIDNKIYGIIPFNKDIDGALLKYALAHPAAIISQKNHKLYTYYAIEGINPEFTFDASTLKDIKVKNGNIFKADKWLIIKGLKPGKNCTISIKTNTGQQIQILLLKKEEALQSYVFNIKGQQTLLLSSEMVFYHEADQKLTFRTHVEKSQFWTYPALNMKHSQLKSLANDGDFKKYELQFSSVEIPAITYKEVTNTSAYQQYLNSLEQKTPDGPTYNIIHNTRLPYPNFELDFPKTLPKGLHDLKLEINYEGNTAAIYANKLLVADNYYVGEPMIYSLKRNESLLKEGNFILQITPLMKDAKIHFEPNTALDFRAQKHVNLKTIKVIPIYQIEL